jgi:hypothetical protein
MDPWTPLSREETRARAHLQAVDHIPQQLQLPPVPTRRVVAIWPGVHDPLNHLRGGAAAAQKEMENHTATHTHTTRASRIKHTQQHRPLQRGNIQV